MTVTAGSTGDGPADQAECDRWAEGINVVIGTLEEAIDKNDQELIDDAVNAIERGENGAMGRGCFIVY